MNPNRGGEQPLPQPEAPVLNGTEQHEGVSDTPETAPITPESTPSRQAAPVISIPSAPPVVLPSDPATAVAQPDNTTTTPAVGATAADTDRIEKPWVDRAKAIISQTKDDPFRQKNEMSKVKAEYIQKRFNKKLKTDDAIA